MAYKHVTGKLCSNVGGPAHVHKLLSPLELLICGEDNNVRNMVRYYSTVLLLVFPSVNLPT